jgi:hypothetical protein
MQKTEAWYFTVQTEQARSIIGLLYGWTESVSICFPREWVTIGDSKQKIVKFHAQKQIGKSHEIDIFTSEDVENISLCIFQYLTLYYIINLVTFVIRYCYIFCYLCVTWLPPSGVYLFILRLCLWRSVCVCLSVSTITKKISNVLWD